MSVISHGAPLTKNQGALNKDPCQETERASQMARINGLYNLILARHRHALTRWISLPDWAFDAPVLGSF